MWRSFIAAGLVYGIGHPALEPYRPVAFTKPIESFHRDVERATDDARHVLSGFNKEWAMNLFSKTVDQAQAAATSGQ